MIKWALLGGAIVSEVAASLSLKAALDHPAFYVIVVIGFVAAFVFLTFTLKQGVALGVAYGIWGAVGVAGTAVLSAIIFGEQLTVVMILGLFTIIVGVLIIELGSQRATETQP